MITGFSKINEFDVLIKTLESEILELKFALDDIQEGDEIDPTYFSDLASKKEVLEQLLKRVA